MRYYSFSEEGQTTPGDDFFMNEAIKEAKIALSLNEVPIGAVIVSRGIIIGRGHNLTEQLNDVTAHAEMQAFTAAAEYLGGKYLKDCTLYVTVEPCVMCAGASYWTQISRIVYGAIDKKRGFSRVSPLITHPKTEIKGGVKDIECALILKNFFLSKRK